MKTAYQSLGDFLAELFVELLLNLCSKDKGFQKV